MKLKSTLASGLVLLFLCQLPGNASASDPKIRNAASTVPSKIEAENWTAMNGVQTEPTADEGGGQNVGWIDAGDWMAYDIDVPSDLQYYLNLRLATPNTGAHVQVFDGSHLLQTVDVPTTGGYQKWITIRIPVMLSSGRHSIRLVSSGNAWNINWLQVDHSKTSNFGKVEAEDWYNARGVQTEPAMDEGGGQNVGWIDHGDYLEYYLLLQGYVWLDFRVATPNPNARFTITLGGQGFGNGMIEVPQTGSYQQWTTVSQRIWVNPEGRLLRITSTGGGAFNINWIVAVKQQGDQNTLIVPGRIEAENYTWAVGTQIEPTSDEGGGYNVGWMSPGDYISFISYFERREGNFNVTFGVATPHDNVKINVINFYGDPIAVVNVPNTGGWQNWTSVTIPIYLDEFNKDIKFFPVNGSVNLNWTEWVRAEPMITQKAVPPSMGPGVQSKAGIFPNPVRDRFTLQVNHQDPGIFKVQVVNSSGAVQKEFALNKSAGSSQHQLSVGGLAPGSYSLVIVGKDWREVFRLIKL